MPIRWRIQTAVGRAQNITLLLFELTVSAITSSHSLLHSSIFEDPHESCRSVPTKYQSTGHVRNECCIYCTLADPNCVINKFEIRWNVWAALRYVTPNDNCCAKCRTLHIRRWVFDLFCLKVGRWNLVSVSGERWAVSVRCSSVMHRQRKTPIAGTHCGEPQAHRTHSKINLTRACCSRCCWWPGAAWWIAFSSHCLNFEFNYIFFWFVFHTVSVPLTIPSPLGRVHSGDCDRWIELKWKTLVGKRKSSYCVLIASGRSHTHTHIRTHTPFNRKNTHTNWPPFRLQSQMQFWMET